MLGKVDRAIIILKIASTILSHYCLLLLLNNHRPVVCVCMCILPHVFPGQFSVVFAAELSVKTLSVFSWSPVGGVLLEECWAGSSTHTATDSTGRTYVVVE